MKRIIDILDGVPAARGDRRKGQSLVEMTMIMPLLLIMFVGMVEIGWFAQNYLNLVEAAKVGARRAPFLNGVYSPQQWRNAASLAPIPQLGFTIDPLDPAYKSNPRVAYRGLGNGAQSCENNNINPSDFGFFNTITCTVVDSMDPLRLNFDNRRDDIVVSAFSVQRVKIGTGTTQTWEQINPGAFASTTAYPTGYQEVVVGRWPSNANECYLWGERDPFDWITNGALDWGLVPNPLDPTNNSIRIHLNYELGVWNNVTGQYDGWIDSAQEKAVGFSWTGQRQIEDDGGNRIDCWGSRWKLADVQRLVNLPNFIPAGSADEQARKQYLPSQGIVIVELYWQHNFLLEDFPLLSSNWSPIYQAMGGGDPDSTRDVVYAWAAFPVPAAEPKLVFYP